LLCIYDRLVMKVACPFVTDVGASNLELPGAIPLKELRCNEVSRKSKTKFVATAPADALPI
jgi:hypothetical protein